MKDPKYSNATLLNLLRQVKQILDAEESDTNSLVIEFTNNVETILQTGGLYNER